MVQKKNNKKEKQTKKTKKKKKNWDVNVDNIFISKSIETKNNSKYLIGELDDVIRPLLLIVPNWVNILELLRIKTKKVRIAIIHWCISV